MYHLWNGLADYVAEHGIEILFGVASFHGTDVGGAGRNRCRCCITTTSRRRRCGSARSRANSSAWT